MSHYVLLDPLTFTHLVNAFLLLFVIASPLLSVLALWHLRRWHIRGIELALWVLIIIVVPVLGATAAFITLNRNSTPKLHSA